MVRSKHLYKETNKGSQMPVPSSKNPLYVNEVIEIEGETYFLPIGHAHVEGCFAGRMALQTVKGDFLVTHHPLSQPISQKHLQLMQDFIESEDEEEITEI